MTAAQVLTDAGDFSLAEISIVKSAIAHHSDKVSIHSPYDELLKDADVLQHYLYNTDFPVSMVKQRRLTNILEELGIEIDLDR